MKAKSRAKKTRLSALFLFCINRLDGKFLEMEKDWELLSDLEKDEVIQKKIVRELWESEKNYYKMNSIEKLQTILKEMESNKTPYITNPQKDFSRNRKVSFYDPM